MPGKKEVFLFTSAYTDGLIFLNSCFHKEFLRNFISIPQKESWAEEAVCWLLSQLCFQMLSWDKYTEKNKSLYHFLIEQGPGKASWC